jgi:hypothetical protein
MAGSTCARRRRAHHRLVVFLIVVLFKPGNDERSRVQRCLRYETVWRGKSEQTGDKDRNAQQEKVPVESGRLAEGKVGTLGDE